MPAWAPPTGWVTDTPGCTRRFRVCWRCLNICWPNSPPPLTHSPHRHHHHHPTPHSLTHSSTQSTRTQSLARTHSPPGCALAGPERQYFPRWMGMMGMGGVRLYACMCACMYVCVHVCMYVCVYACCVYVCMCVCMCACMYVCMHVVCMRVCVYVCMHVCVYVWALASGRMTVTAKNICTTRRL